jgi:hypothetical protein
MEKYREVKLSDLRTKDGYVVAIEGDDKLYDKELDQWLKENVDNYILLNNIYDHPEKLAQLKDIKIDAFIFQTTGIRPELQTLIDLYIEKIGNFPKNWITVFMDKEDCFWKIFKLMDEYEVYLYEYVHDDLYMVRQDHSCKVRG